MSADTGKNTFSALNLRYLESNSSTLFRYLESNAKQNKLKSDFYADTRNPNNHCTD